MKTFQRKLFHHLHVLHGNDTTWKHVCMDLLQIGKSAFYKRMRGETPMMIGEIVTLARHFNLSVDQLLVENNSLFPFHFAGSIYWGFSAKKFFATLLDDFFLIKSKPQARLFIVARDLPLFYYLESPALLNFKIFNWEQTKPGRDAWAKEYRHLDWKREWQMVEHCTFLYNFFRSLPRTEIWADDFLLKTLRQITYHLEHTSGFEIDEALAVLDDLERVLANMKLVVTRHYDTAVNGSREQIKVYENKSSEMQNMLVVKWANQHSVHLPVNWPMYIKSHHQGIAEYAVETCRLLAEQSNPFDKMTAAARVAWFDRQLEQVRSLRKSQVFVFS